MLLPKHIKRLSPIFFFNKRQDMSDPPIFLTRVLCHEVDEALAVQLRGHAAQLVPSPAQAFVPRFRVLHLGVHLVRFDRKKTLIKAVSIVSAAAQRDGRTHFVTVVPRCRIYRFYLDTRRFWSAPTLLHRACSFTHARRFGDR